jgi:hypothetical protein
MCLGACITILLMAILVKSIIVHAQRHILGMGYETLLQVRQLKVLWYGAPDTFSASDLKLHVLEGELFYSVFSAR